MLRRYSNSRTFKDNLRLGVFTAIVAGMVNVASVILFYSFTSNLTGHYAILAQEIADGKVFQIFVVLFWILLFFSGSFLSNFVVINGTKKNAFKSHSLPILLEIICFIGVGIYGQFFYKETLAETEILVSVLLFAMGLQNGLTASISNFQVKTTHLTGTTTDLALHLSMLTKKEYRENVQVVEKAKLLGSIVLAYVLGGVAGGLVIHFFQFHVYYVISAAIAVVLVYDYIKSELPIVRLRREKELIKHNVKRLKETISNTAPKEETAKN